MAMGVGMGSSQDPCSASFGTPQRSLLKKRLHRGGGSLCWGEERDGKGGRKTKSRKAMVLRGKVKRREKKGEGGETEGRNWVKTDHALWGWGEGASSTEKVEAHEGMSE